MNQLPKGWMVAKLGDVLKVQNGYAFKSTEFLKENVDNTPLIRQSQLIGDKVDLSDCVFVDKKYLIEKKNYIIRQGDILIGMSGSIGKVSFYEYDYPALLNQRVGKLKLLDDNVFDKSFFAYLLVCLEQEVQKNAKGMGVQNISGKDIENLSISYPESKATQTAIVSKIESLFAEIDVGIACLKKARQQLAHYRQALLKNAFSGKLTEQWRASHAHQESTELLAQIQTARAQHYQSQLADWQTAVEQWEASGKTGKKPGKPKAPSAVVKYEAGEDLPSGWVRVALSEISDIGSGMSVSSNRKLNHPITVNYLRVGNVQRGYLSLSEIKQMQIESNHLEKYRLKFGDVLFNEGGDRDKLGRGWIWQNEIENCITQNHVFRAIPFIKSIYFSKYISYLGNSQYGKRYFEETGKQTTNLASINKTVLSNFPILLPSIEEQTEIVRLLDSQLTAADQFAAELAAQLKHAEHLKQSVLKAAFAGRLS